MQPNDPPNPTSEPKPDAGGYYKQVSDADPLAQQTSAPAQTFDFMLKDQSKPKKFFGLGGGMGAPAKILLGATGVLIIILAAAVFLGGGKTNSQQLLDLMAQSQEILRVTELEKQQLKDQNVLNLAATTEAVLASQQSDFSAYLTAQKIKYKPSVLATHTNEATDAQLQAAAQNNNLDDAYVIFLNNTLKTYQASLNTVFGATKGKDRELCIQVSISVDKTECGQTYAGALQSAYQSVNTLLNSSQFKS